MTRQRAVQEDRELVDIHELSIGEYTYQIRLAGGLTSLRAASILANVLAPLFSGLTSMQSAKGAFARAITYFFQSPDLGDNLEKLVSLFASTTQVVTEGGRKTASLEKCLDQHFAGRLDAMVKWLAFCLKVNLGSFLDALPDLGSDAAETLEQFGLTVPKDAAKTGGSGES